MTLRGGLSAILRWVSLGTFVVVAACQPASPTPTATPGLKPSAQPATATPTSAFSALSPGDLEGVAIEVWHPWYGVEAGLFESQAAEFNKVNPWGITVSTVGQHNYAQLYDNVSASLANGTGPDLAIGLPEYGIEWAARGQVVDLTGYVGDPEYGLSPTEVRDFPPVFWAQDELAGKRLGVPAERGATFLLYNASWAQELGYSAPPSTAAQFRQQACRAHTTFTADSDRANDAEGGWLIDPSSTTFLAWMAAFGGGVLEGDGYRFLTPRNLEALTFVKQLYDDGCGWSLPPGGDAAAAFAGRQALFGSANLEDLPGVARAVASAGNSDQWTVLPFPGTTQSSATVYGSSYTIFKSTAQRQLATWLFVRWLLSTENQVKWVEATGLFPLRSSEIPLLTSYEQSHPQWVAAVDLIPDASIQPQLASWREVRVMVGDGFDAMFRSNTPSGRVAEILAIMQRAASDLSK
jgi:multiple sugar transport system substrate-binding protein